MPHWPKPLGMRPDKYNLDNTSELLQRLGNPHINLPPVVHVAGTNGKGSTIAFIKQILISNGYKVHVYTSPHLIYFNERITLANEYISSSYLYSTLEECREAAKGLKLTFFEGTTVAAFLAFSRVKADIVIVETGLGGRLDATNVIESPIMTIITPISLDHQEHLGASVELIAVEKAGIIKTGATCVISEQTKEALTILEGAAVMQRAPVYRKNFEWSCENKVDHMVFQSGGEEIALPTPSLPGEHQITNAGAAIAASTILANKYNYQIEYEHLVKGVQEAYWPARLERITTGKLIDTLPSNKFEVFLDGAHNLAGAEAIKKWAKRPFYCILGMTEGRDVIAFLNILKPMIKYLYCVCVESEPRSQTSEAIYNAACAVNISSSQCESLLNAFQQIAKRQNKETETILICGSLFLAGDVLKQNS